MKENSIINENNQVKTLNELLNRIHLRIKSNVQKYCIDYLINIFENEEKII